MALFSGFRDYFYPLRLSLKLLNEKAIYLSRLIYMIYDKISHRSIICVKNDSKRRVEVLLFEVEGDFFIFYPVLILDHLVMLSVHNIKEEF